MFSQFVPIPGVILPFSGAPYFSTTSSTTTITSKSSSLAAPYEIAEFVHPTGPATFRIVQFDDDTGLYRFVPHFSLAFASLDLAWTALHPNVPTMPLPAPEDSLYHSLSHISYSLLLTHDRQRNPIYYLLRQCLWDAHSADLLAVGTLEAPSGPSAQYTSLSTAARALHLFSETPSSSA